MNKKMSRIAAIALSAAMVTSAFAMSTSSAFAATTPVITPATNTYAAAYLKSGTNTLKAADVFSDKTATVKAGNDSKTANLDFDNAVYSVSGGVATINNGVITLNKAGSFTVTATKVALDDDVTLETVKYGNTETYKNTTNTITATATVKVYSSGSVLVLPTINGDKTGKFVSNAATVGINDSSSFAAYKVAQAGTGDDPAAINYGTALSGYTFKSSNSNVTIDETSGEVAAQTADDVHTGYATISAKDASGNSAASASLTIAKYYDVTGTEKTEVSNDYGQDTKTTINNYDVTGMDIKVADGADLTITGADASVGAVTATNSSATATGTVTVAGGNVKSITTDTGVVTIAPKTDTGSVVVGDINTKANVVVTGATVSDVNSDTTYSSVKTGNITTASDVTVTTSADDDNTKAPYGVVTLGNVVADGNVTISTSKTAKTLTTGTISGEQGLYADSPYHATFTLAAGKFTTGDLKYFGKVTVSGATTAGASSLTAAAINTGTYSDGTKTYGSEKITNDSTIVVTEKSKLNASSVFVQQAPDGNDGILTVPAGSVTIADSSVQSIDSTGLDLYVTGATKGTVLYNANANAAALFNVPGVTTVKGTNTGKNMYNYTAATVDFLGFTLNQSNVDLGDGASTTLTTTLLPAVDLPTGVTIAWSADKDTVKLTPSADGRSCTVASTGYTAQNVNGGNTVTVTANLMKDGAAYAPFNSDKATGTCTVNLTAEQAPVLTTKVQNLGDTEAKAVTADTVVKMTQSTYATVNFSADKAGITAADLKYGTGSDKVAQTGTYDPWNGTAGKYYIYANGKVGDKVGVYANGQKIFQVEIVDRPFTSDTTVDFDLKAGSKYQFKITPNADTTIKDFTFNTANDAALSTWGFTKNADGTVTATVKANKAGKYGVYCDINGVKYKVFAVTVK